MTTLAMTDPPLRRLFERLDFAPQPADEYLARIFEYWIKKRGGRIAPAPREMVSSDLGDGAACAFLLQLDPRTREPSLTFGGAAFETLMGPCDPGALVLTDASQRRGAVRLRRLSELVRSRAEPVLADFGMRTADGILLEAEIVVAPLSSDGTSVDGLFGGLALRHAGKDLLPTAHVSRVPPRTGAPLLFALKSASEFGARIAQCLGQPLQSHEERDFEDGEHKARPLVDVEEGDVYVVAGLHGGAGQSVNDRLCRLLFFVGALKDAGAARVTVVAPYLCYARKDRRTQPRDPVTTRYVAQLFDAMGAHGIITMEVHNLAAFQNAFRCRTTHLDAYEFFSRHVAAMAGDAPVTVVSPDIGGAKRAELFRVALEKCLGRPVARAVADKQRSLGRVTGDLFMGDVSGGLAVILDDLISTGETMARVAHQCRQRGASRIVVAATHGVGGASALDHLTGPDIAQVILTNTIPQPPAFVSTLGDRLTILDVSETFADAIPLRRIMHAT